MSAVESCRGCGGLFAFLPRGMCGVCLDLREERYQSVREWLADNRGATVLQAAQATGVEESLIAEFIREGRLERVADAAAAQESAERAELRARIAREMTERSVGGATAPGRAPSSAPPRGMRSRGS